MITKGQIIKVKSTGTRYRLDRIQRHKSRKKDVYQFYPVEQRRYVYPFGMDREHLETMLRMEQFTIEQ